MKFSFLVLLAFSLCSCIYYIDDDSKTATSSDDVRPEFSALDLYMSRPSLSKTSFEHYRILGDKLFIECGAVKGGENVAQEQNIIPLEEDDQTFLIERLNDLYELLQNSNFKFEEPNQGSGFANSGECSLHFSANNNNYHIDTSLDSISDASTPAEHRLRRLAETFRALGNTPCGFKTFYGLGILKK